MITIVARYGFRYPRSRQSECTPAGGWWVGPRLDVVDDISCAVAPSIVRSPGETCGLQPATCAEVVRSRLPAAPDDPNRFPGTSNVLVAGAATRYDVLEGATSQKQRPPTRRCRCPQDRRC